ncbi:hypothetical protein Hdeb2414_s0032g00713281 [Helianthus debilis subsp. tardiflorus]
MHSRSIPLSFSSKLSRLSSSWRSLAIVGWDPLGVSFADSLVGCLLSELVDVLRRASSCSSRWRSSLWRWKSNSILERKASCFLLLLTSVASLRRLSSSTCASARSLAFCSCFHFAYSAFFAASTRTISSCNSTIILFSAAISSCNLTLCFSQAKSLFRYFFSLLATSKHVLTDSEALNFEASISALISAFSVSSRLTAAFARST